MATLLRIEPPSRGAAPGGFALYRLGFRPFYLVAAMYTAVAVPLWLFVWAGAAPLPLGLPAHLWHAHEMIFGFATAVIVGFLFTAVRNWTGLDTPAGTQLAGLVGLWIAARAAFVAGLPAAAIAMEIAFLGLVGFALLRRLVRARNSRNYFLAALFVALAAADLAFALAAAGAIGLAPDLPVRFALYMVVMLTFVIGGRVIPGFTKNAIREARQFRWPWLDRAAIAAAALAFGTDLAGAEAPLVIAAASAAALLHAVRLAGWAPLSTRSRPILWILHAAYAWAPVGFALMAAAAAGLVARPLAIHAFALGTVGGLIVGMITRTALGHTGRMLVAGRAETWMYSLVMAAAALRVLGPIALPEGYVALTSLAGVLWSAAFALYAVVYWPRLSAPRVDGREG